MPRVPTVGLNASPRPAFQAPGVTAFRDYAPQQIQQAGKAMEGMGQVITDIAFKVENDIHDANTLEASNEAEFASRSLLQKQEQLKGKEAVDAKQGVLDEFNATMSGISDRLHPIEKRQFKKIQDRLQGKFTLRVEAHHVKAAAEHKQQQMIAQGVFLADSIVSGKILIESPDAFPEKHREPGVEDARDTQGGAVLQQFPGDVPGVVGSGASRDAQGGAILQQGKDSEYDYAAAEKAGLGPDADGHWPSRDPKTGRILKSINHPTFHKTVRGEEAAGMAWWHDPKTDGWHTFPVGITDEPESMGLERANPGVQEPDQIVSPQFLSDFSRYLLVQKQIGEDEGKSGDALTLFVMSKAGDLLEGVVTTKLESDDPSEVASVAQLLEGLPEGTISKTKHQQLLDLAKDRSLVVEATDWAAGVVENDSVEVADALRDAFELLKTDPDRAEKRIELLIKYQRAKDAVESSADGALLDEYREIVARGGELTPDQKITARSKGWTAQIETVRRAIDVTDDYGSNAFHLFNNNPTEMLRNFNSGGKPDVGLMVKSLGPHMSEKDLRTLTGQYNAYIKHGSGPANSNRDISFNELTTAVTTVTNTRLHELDELLALRHAEDGVKSFQTRLLNTSEDRRSRALQMAQNRFSIDVVTRANTILETMPKGEKVDRNAILQKASEAVWDDGWLDSKKTINKYTTELADRPKVDDALIAERPKAERQLREERETRVIEAAFFDTPGALVMRPGELRKQLDESFLGLSPATARNLARAKHVARADLALDYFSPAEIDERAEALRQEKVRAEDLKIADTHRSVKRGLVDSLVSPDIQVSQLVLEGFEYAGHEKWLTKDFLEKNPEYGALAAKISRERGHHRRKWGRELWSIEKARLRTNKYLSLPQMEDLKKEYTGSGGTPDEWENFALLFYPGPVEDLPRDLQAQISQMRSLAITPGSDIPRDAPGFVPRESVPRFKAIRAYLTETNSKGEFINL